MEAFTKSKVKVNVVALVNRFLTSSVKCWTANFCIHTNKGPVIMMNKLKSIYNSPFKDSHSHPIQTCFPMIASNADLGTTPLLLTSGGHRWRPVQTGSLEDLPPTSTDI